MSAIINGQIVDTELSKNAMGGTEMMRGRLIKNVPQSLLQNVAIHFSRVRELDSTMKNIFYCHDLDGDPESFLLKDAGWAKFDKIVFVSYWQRDRFIQKFKLPYSKCTVIHNAIETKFIPTKRSGDVVRFIYHTTPHRGLQLLYPIIDKLSQEYKVHLDVFSSFSIYGWENRDKSYRNLFSAIESHENMTYHGAKPNNVVLNALKKSHIFLYPCIWSETSCIALIEAGRSGCLQIYPTLGALTETPEGLIHPYEYTEDANKHMTTAYSIAKYYLELNKNTPKFLNNLGNSKLYFSEKHDIETFKQKWIGLLNETHRAS
jgi:UDP-glucose:(glucosyl)LPS alpha-1,2-glucosyltransferase